MWRPRWRRSWPRAPGPEARTHGAHAIFGDAKPARARYRHAMSALGRVLIIAGSDSGGGAGIQADIKTVTALGGYAATAITAVTVQNTLGVSAAYPTPPAIVLAQGRAVLDDIGADAIKTGMLGDAAMVEITA